MELWYVKVDSGSSSAGSGTASLTIPPMASSMYTSLPPMPPNEALAKPAHVLSAFLKPVGIENLGHTCHLGTLLDYIFGCTTPKEIDTKETTKKHPKNITTSIFT